MLNLNNQENKNWKKWAEPQEMWGNNKRANIHIIWALKGKEKKCGTEKKNWRNRLNTNWWIWRKINEKKSIPRYIIIKLLKTKEKKSAKEQHFKWQRISHRKSRRPKGSITTFWWAEKRPVSWNWLPGENIHH